MTTTLDRPPQCDWFECSEPSVGTVKVPWEVKPREACIDHLKRAISLGYEAIRRPENAR